MTTASRSAPEKKLATIALLVALASAARFTLLHSRDNEQRWRHAADFVPHGEQYAPVRTAEPAGTSPEWEKPVPRRTDAWSYDLFSTPDIFFDAAAGGFTTYRPAQPLNSAKDGMADAPPTKSVPYRLQLVGYAGAKGRLFGIFENVATGETIIAAEGKVLESLGLVVEQVVVSRATAVTADEGTVANVATAVIRDETRHERVTLTNASRLLVEPSAVMEKIALVPQARESLASEHRQQERRDSARLELRDTSKLSVERDDRLPPAAQQNESPPPSA